METLRRTCARFALSDVCFRLLKFCWIFSFRRPESHIRRWSVFGQLAGALAPNLRGQVMQELMTLRAIAQNSMKCPKCQVQISRSPRLLDWLALHGQQYS